MGVVPSRRIVVVTLALLMLAAGALLAVGLTRDLPSPEPDEPFFVLPAVSMAAAGSANPHWFGHPASTVITPLAFVYRARDVVFHGAPLTGAAPSVIRRYRSDPSSFYVIGRLWTMLLTVGTIPLVYLVGRRVATPLVGLLAAGMWTALPLVLEYGRLVRSDSAATAFGLLAILACLRAIDVPSWRRFAVAGAAIGVAVSTRYFMATLAVAFVAAWWCARRETGARPPVAMLLAGGGAALGAFALATPFFLLDWNVARRSLGAEGTGHFTDVSHGLADNFTYYAFHALPDALTWPGFLAAVLGIALAVVHRDRLRLVVAAFVAAFVAALLPAPLHWERWLIPVLPILAVFAIDAVVQAAGLVGAPDRKARMVGALTIGLVVVCGASVAVSARATHTATVPSTRVAMRNDIRRLVPAGARVATEVKGPSLGDLGYDTFHVFDLPANGTVADYTAHGYHYLVVNAYVALQYRLRPQRWPAHTQFYQYLRWHGRLLADERSGGDRLGPHLKLYRIDDAEFAKPTGASVQATTRRSSRDRVLRPSHEYPSGGRLFDRPTQ